MTRLFTKQDPFHIHALLGALVLLHFCYRWVLLFSEGSAFKGEDPKFSAAAVLLHFLLPMSSLLLHLPKVRNFNKPMIWPEFRLHSITFATRHVIGTILVLFELSNLWIGLGLVLSTMLAAEVTTFYYGDYNKRTTNAMPYPEKFNDSCIRGTKAFYAKSQFAATACILVNDANIAFTPLLAIQAAPFLMTLVRKGKASAALYHSIYSWALILPALAMIPSVYKDPDASKAVIKVMVFADLAQSMRLRFRLNKYLVWPLAVCAGNTMLHVFAVSNALEERSMSLLCIFIAIFGAARQSLHSFIWYFYYAPPKVASLSLRSFRSKTTPLQDSFMKAM